MEEEAAWEQLLDASARRKAISEQKNFLLPGGNEQWGIAGSDHRLSRISAVSHPQKLGGVSIRATLGLVQN